MKSLLRKINLNRGIVFLIVASSMLIISQLYWISNGYLSSHWDMGRHLSSSLIYRNSISKPNYYYNNIKPNYIQNTYSTWTTLYEFYPPLTYVNTAIFYLMLHKVDINTALISIVPFGLVIIIFSYLLAKEFMKESSAILTSIFIITSPIVITQIHEYMLDVPSLAMFILSLYFLFKSNFFNKRLYSILFGVSFGLALMTKWTFILDIFPPLLFTLIITSKNLYIKVKREKDYIYFFNVLYNILFSIIFIALISFPWYINNISALKTELLFNADYGKTDYLKPGIPWLLDYLFIIENTDLYIVYFIIFLVAFIYITFVKKEKKFYIILASFIVSYLFFTKINNKDIRYIIPLLIYPSLYFGKLWDYIKGNRKYIPFVSFVIFALLQAYFVAFYMTDKKYSYSIDIPNLFPITIFTNNGYTSGPPSKDNWKVKETAAYIDDYNNKFNKSNKNEVYVNIDNGAQYTKYLNIFNYPPSTYTVYYIGDNTKYYNTGTLQYFLNIKNNNFGVATSKYELSKGGYLVINASKGKTEETIKSLPSGYTTLYSSTLPDNTELYVVALANTTAQPATNHCEMYNNEEYLCHLK